jgi:hypothetical protein
VDRTVVAAVTRLDARLSRAHPNDAMSRLTALDWPTVVAAYDFTRFSTIVDLGGGHGRLLALVLEAAPSATGVLPERELVLAEAEQQLRVEGLLPRCRLVAGSLFDTAPPDGDLYVMRRVIHDFDDDEAVAILTNVRRHLPAGAIVLLLESVVPPGNLAHFATALDLDMMLFVGGRERTEPEFRALLGRAGLRVRRVVPTVSTIALIEAEAEADPSAEP